MSEIRTIDDQLWSAAENTQGAPVHHFSHFTRSVQFYGESSYLFDGLATFIGSALLGGRSIRRHSDKKPARWSYEAFSPARSRRDSRGAAGQLPVA